MRRITFWVLSTVATLILLFNYRTSMMGSGFAEASVRESTTKSGTGGGGTGYPGSAVKIRWGTVQVAIVVKQNKIIDVRVLSYPTGNGQDKKINLYALPVLRERVLKAQSADIDAVSGATFTSGGYRTSLQAAIDAAHLR